MSINLKTLKQRELANLIVQARFQLAERFGVHTLLVPVEDLTMLTGLTESILKLNYHVLKQGPGEMGITLQEYAYEARDHNNQARIWRKWIEVLQDTHISDDFAISTSEDA